MTSDSSVSIVVPRAGDCPHRAQAWEYVSSRLDGYEICEGWGDPDLWCKADAVADGLRKATGDVLVIHDADVVSDFLPDSVEAVESGKYQWSSPHRSVWRLTEEATKRFIDGERDPSLLPVVEPVHQSVLGGGIVVITREKYEQVPLDPRFIGWGGEDHAWHAALYTLAGKSLVIKQPLWHLWHPPQQRMTRKVGGVANDELRGRYLGCRSMAGQMRRLIEEGRCHSKASSQLTT